MPVPVFETGGSRGSYTGLNKEFQIYIIDAKQGMYVNSDLLSKENLMPENWKHGFTKGYAISKKERTIIYWTVVW